MTRLHQEYRRVTGHRDLALAVDTEGAGEIFVAAVRSGASIESTLTAYSKAAYAAGPTAVQRLQDTIDQAGYGVPTVEGLAGVPIGSAARSGGEMENAERVISQINAMNASSGRSSAPKKDLIDLFADDMEADRGGPGSAYAQNVVAEMERRRGKTAQASGPKKDLIDLVADSMEEVLPKAALGEQVVTLMEQRRGKRDPNAPFALPRSGAA